jgi:flagellar motor switch protein FliM
MEIGQTLPFYVQPDQPMLMQCGGVPLAYAHPGQRRRNIAVSLATEVGKVGGRP